MTSPNTELRLLRISVARAAQAVGLHEHIPGCKEHWEAPYEVLSKAATDVDHGWNTLVALIIHEIEHLKVRAYKYDADKDDGPDDDGDETTTGQADC